ncbi:MAG: hypothetical protein BroJett040_13370 [Oligoflexia bacterium]|nr:MAG: hypothetical protein BroJett040_13370 [Oligoflexia bacterium]
MTKTILKVAAILVLGALSACSKSSDTPASGGSSITFAGKISGMGLMTFDEGHPSPMAIDDDGLIVPFATTDYKLFCVTFNSSPTAATSNFATDGSFSVSLPANTPFGCFVNSATTNLPVATLYKSGSGSGMSSTDSTSLSLSSSVDVGTLTLDLANNKVVVPASSVSGSTASSTASLNLADIDNYEWTMSCVTTGVTEIDNACNSFISSGASVYLRVLSGTESGNTIYGINVWESNAKFTACGSIDFATATKTQIESGGFAFATSGNYAPVTAGSFSGYGAGSCDLRSAGGDSSYSSENASSANGYKNIQSNYCLAPMVTSGTGYSFVCEDSASNACGGGGTYMHRTAVTIIPGASATEMYGNFNTSESRTGSCGTADSSSTFNIKFTRGTQY